MVHPGDRHPCARSRCECNEYVEPKLPQVGPEGPAGNSEANEPQAIIPLVHRPLLDSEQTLCGVPRLNNALSYANLEYDISHDTATRPMCKKCLGIAIAKPDWRDAHVNSNQEEKSTTGNDIDQAGVNHPKHYNIDPSGIECIEVVRHRNFNIGSAFKYLWRNGLKAGSGDTVEKQINDLEKAIWYIQDEIGRIRSERQDPEL